jgi:DNA-directed RNA polymerase specialized sigma24 family protein
LSRDEVEFVADLDETGAATRAAVGEALTMAKEALAAMQICVDQLAPRQRDVLRADLANDGQASTGDLASQMNISRNAVYQARRDGRLALRSALQRRGHELPPAADGHGGDA